MRSASKVCIVIPTYEEAENLPRLVRSLGESLRKENFTLIVVDDNSPDGTAEIAEKLSRHGNIVVDRRQSKLGIGSAIRDGIKIALSFPNCNYIVTMDADMSHNPKDIPHLLKEAEDTDLIQGSRYIEGGRIIGWSPHRKTVSYIANILCRLLFRTGLHEHTTSFRVHSRKCAKAIVENTRSNGYEWFIESLLVAKDHGFKVREVPITFVNRTHGKSKLKFRDVFQWAVHILNMFFRRCLNLKGIGASL